MILLHPFMPFLTEEIYHITTQNRKDGDDICVASYPTINFRNNFSEGENVIESFYKIKELINIIRDQKARFGISPKVKAKVFIDTQNSSFFYSDYTEIINKLTAVESITSSSIGGITKLIKTDRVFVDVGYEVDKESERKKLTEEISYLKGFIASVQKKLSNEKFVQNAKPEVIENERKKLADGISKLNSLENALPKL
jgi:valyl-tRNA synthetase